MLLVLSVIYDYSAVLECYYQNELQYKIKLTDSFINTRKVDNDIIISIYRKSQKHKLHKECSFRISKENEILYIPYGGVFKGLKFDDFYKKLIIYNNVKVGEQNEKIKS